jgi:hypothetical protein
MHRVTGNGRAQAVLGLIVGLGLLAFTLVQVDLAATIRAVTAASIPLVGLALAVVAVDLAIRGLRWQLLLRGVRSSSPIRFRLAIAYLGIGYLANQLMPARTGDLLRAHLAGRAFVLPRLTTLGTILVERVADATMILGLAIVSSTVIAGVAAIGELTTYGLVIAGMGLVVLLFSYWLLFLGPWTDSRVGGLARTLAERLWAGMRGVTSIRGAVALTATTLAAALTAVSVAWLAMAAVGITLAPDQAVLLLSGISLALAIPAAPGALGTYEFVGVTVLSAFGIAPTQALAGIVLLRIVTTLPSVSLGVVAAWSLHIHPTFVQALAPSPRASADSQRT